MNNDLVVKDMDWQQCSDACRVAFVLAMEGRNYGPDETLDAWVWFYAGWTSFSGKHR